MKLNNPYFSLSRKNNIIQRQIFLSSPENTLNHHPFLHNRITPEQTVKSLRVILQLHIRKISHGSQINAQKRQISPAQIPDCPYQSSVSAKHKSTLHIIRNCIRNNMAFRVLPAKDTPFSSAFNISPYLVCNPQIFTTSGNRILAQVMNFPLFYCFFGGSVFCVLFVILIFRHRKRTGRWFARSFHGLFGGGGFLWKSKT